MRCLLFQYLAISVFSEDEQQGMTLSFHQLLADGEDAHIAARLGLQPA